MVSKENPGQGGKDTKKSTPKNEKQKAGSNQEQIAAVSKEKPGQGGKDTKKSTPKSEKQRAGSNQEQTAAVSKEKPGQGGKDTIKSTPKNEKQKAGSNQEQTASVSKENPGQGGKNAKKSTLKNEKQKAGSNREQTAAVSKQKKGRKGNDTSTDLRADQSWPPKPWIKKQHRDGKNQCYANPRTGQEFYTEADLERYLAYLARMEAEEAVRPQPDISKGKIDSDETSEPTISDERAAETITNDVAAPEIAVDGASYPPEDLDFIFREIESRERAQSTPAVETTDLEWIIIDDDDDYVLPVVAPDNASPNIASEYLMWDMEPYMMAEASASGEKAVVEGTTNDDVAPKQDSDEEYARERKRKGKEVVRICDKCNKEKCKCRPKDGIPRGGINIR